jgi:hypothetical protein
MSRLTITVENNKLDRHLSGSPPGQAVFDGSPTKLYIGIDLVQVQLVQALDIETLE